MRPHAAEFYNPSERTHDFAYLVPDREFKYDFGGLTRRYAIRL